ncbi:DUF2889 domain-containing protein [Ramlibacter sp. AN1015]|uniref:DUF2889 domain-containing protein n=1 Tax=Ramlibacter sp. AN1015 TaxID=3133428 RepID=UPI0030C64613
MPLPAPQPRTPMHTRQVVYNGWRRDDGLWDLEAVLTDTKPFAADLYRPAPLPAGSPVHDLSIRVTLDDAFVVQAIATSMDATPFGECQQATDPMQQVVGVRMGPGWRQALERILGGVRGCTHLRELLFNMATVAYQTIPSGQMHLRRLAGEPEPAQEGPPYHVGRCITWDAEGAVVRRHHPEFVGWQPLRRKTVVQG